MRPGVARREPAGESAAGAGGGAGPSGPWRPLQRALQSGPDLACPGEGDGRARRQRRDSRGKVGLCEQSMKRRHCCRCLFNQYP